MERKDQRQIYKSSENSNTNIQNQFPNESHDKIQQLTSDITFSIKKSRNFNYANNSEYCSIDNNLRFLNCNTLDSRIIVQLYEKYKKSNKFYHYKLKYPLRIFFNSTHILQDPLDEAIDRYQNSMRALFYQLVKTIKTLPFFTFFFNNHNFYYESNIKNIHFLIHGNVDEQEKIISLIKTHKKISQ